MYCSSLFILLQPFYSNTSLQHHNFYNNNMEARHPMQRLPFHCPFPHCGKGFDNLAGIRKLLQAQSVDWTKAVQPETAETVNTTRTTLESVQQLSGHGNDNASISSFDNILFAEDMDNNENEGTGFVNECRTVESHTNKQYFECKLLKLSMRHTTYFNK